MGRAALTRCSARANTGGIGGDDKAYIAELEAAALAVDVDPERLAWFEHRGGYYSLPGGYSVLRVE